MIDLCICVACKTSRPSTHTSFIPPLFTVTSSSTLNSQSWHMASRRNIQYSRLASDEYDDFDASGLRHDPRFDYSPKQLDVIPWKSIGLALFLLLLGSILLCLSIFIFTGHMGGEHSQAYGLLGLGIVSFLPGYYETRIAYYSWRGAQGYRFASIPAY